MELMLESDDNIVTDYTFKTYMTPFWSGNVVYNETLMFVRDSKGNIPSAPLLYEPNKVIAVKSFDLNTEYEEGRDYTIEDGQICLTSNSRIFAWDYDDYYPSVATLTNKARTGGGYIVFGEGTKFISTQVAVTYTHSDEWKGLVPAYQASSLPKVTSKLNNKEKIKIVYYGDSITVGWSASVISNYGPKMPKWADLVTEDLIKSFGYNDLADINVVNTAVGGKNTVWGVENVEELVNAHDPDLVIIAFGMNAGAVGIPVNFKNDTLAMINAIRAYNPDTEFILVSTMLPNKEFSGFYTYQEFYENELLDIKASINGIAVAPITSVHKHLLTKKRYYDMTGNNVNHPNDFMIRAYAHTISSVIS